MRGACGPASGRRRRSRRGARQAAARDLGEKPAGAHPHDRLARDLDPGEEPLQHPVEAVLLGRAGAAGQAEDRRLAEPAEQDEVAGIDRHAEMLDDAAAG